MFVAVMLPEALTAALGADGLALGSDPSLWGLMSLNLRHGIPSHIPPIYSWLVAAMDGLSGVDLVSAASRITGMAFALAAGASYLIARRFGADRASAIGVGLLLCFQADLVVLALQIQPEALIMLVMLTALPLVVWFLAAPTLRRAIALAVFGAVVYATREHGAVLAAGFFILALAAPGASRLRAARAAVVGVAILLAPVLALSKPALPWDAVWTGRVGVAVQLQETFTDSGNPQGNVEVARHRALHARGDTLGIALYHARNAVSGAPLAWSWLGLGALAALLLPRDRRIAIWLSLLPALPTLPILSQPRHVLVLVPVGIVSVAAALRAAPSGTWGQPARLSLGVIAGALALWGVSRWDYVMVPVVENVSRATRDRAFGESICKASRGFDLISGGTYSYMVYCPMRRHKVVATLTDADWRALYVGPTPPSPYWRPSQLSYQSASGTLYVFTLAPWIGKAMRPCQRSTVASDVPYLTLDIQPAELEPACGGAANTSLLGVPFQ